MTFCTQASRHAAQYQTPYRFGVLRFDVGGPLQVGTRLTTVVQLVAHKLPAMGFRYKLIRLKRPRGP